MTCIVGIAHAGRVTIGGDSAACTDWDLQVVATPKVFARGTMLFGVSGNFRMGQLARYTLSIPPQTVADDMEYMVRDFAGSLRECLADVDFGKGEEPDDNEWHLLIGYRGRLYEMQADFGVAVPRDGYSAIGAGRFFALGAMHQSKGKPADRIRAALKTAAYFCPDVRGPFVIRTV